MDQRPTSPRTQRPRAFSSRSDRSNGSKGKEDLTESPADKAKRDGIWKGSSKANPNAAINEAQPGAAALLEESTLQPLREISHRDANGNVIADPDLSNPTRPRLERPLDTIRSFEKAIDNGYKRRSSNRSESYQESGSRRNSGHYGGSSYENSPNRFGQSNGGYYGGSRADSYSGGPRTRYNGSRMQSEGAIQRPYGQHAHQPSQHTMNTDPGSDSTGPWATSTDPSSENSSIDPNHSSARPSDPYGPGANGYGNSNGGGGFRGPILEEQGQGSYGGAYPQQESHNGYGPRNGAPPVQPPQEQRRPIALGNSGDAPLPPGKLPPTSRPEPENNRKSWLKRRFSKNKQ